MINYDDFIMELSSILPLPTDNAFVSAGGILIAVDLAEATYNIEKVIKKYKKQNRLTTAELKKLKQLALERYDHYLKALKN